MNREPLELSKACAKYPRLAAALCDRCMLSNSEAATALYGVANALPEAGSEAVMHFGGPLACVRAAFRNRAMARRYSGNPMWQQWHEKAMPRHSWCPSWPDRIDQMRAVARELGGDDRYLQHDIECDVQQIRACAPSPHQFIWLLHESGTEIVNLSLPRAKVALEQAAPMSCWKSIYLIDLERGLVRVTAQQAIHAAARAHPYRLQGNAVLAPKGTMRDVLALFCADHIGGRCGEFDVTISVAGMAWSVLGAKLPHLRREEFYLIERTILDHLIERQSSLFAKIRQVRYQVMPGAFLTSEQFRRFYQCDTTAFPRLWYSADGSKHYGALLPLCQEDAPERGQAWLAEFKQAIKAARGTLRGVRFGIELPTTWQQPLPLPLPLAA